MAEAHVRAIPTSIEAKPPISRRDVPGRHHAGLLAKNTLWNFFGQLVPLIVALFCIRFILQQLGAARFGILTIAWTLIGYFSVFDLGLGRALTRDVAAHAARDETDKIGQMSGFALILMMVFGVLGAVALAVLSPWVTVAVLQVPQSEVSEAISVFRILALALPVVILTAGMRGILEGLQAFAGPNILRIVLGVLNFGAPVCVLLVSRSLVWITAALFAARLVILVGHWVLLRRKVNCSVFSRAFDSRMIRELMTSGGWMTVSNVIGPLMVQFDRFLIAALISLSAVAYYVTPYEFITKFWLIPASLTGVLFPAIAGTIEASPDRSRGLYWRSLKYVFIALFPATLLVAAFAGPLLTLWLGSEFALHSTRVLQWLTLGVFVNSLAQVPFAYVQAAGRSDWTAKFHMIEAPLYFVFLLLGARLYGIDGVAIAWTLRVSVDAILLFAAAHRLGVEPTVRQAGLLGAATLALVTAILLSSAFGHALIFALVTLSAFAWLIWHRILWNDERTFLRSRLRSSF